MAPDPPDPLDEGGSIIPNRATPTMGSPISLSPFDSTRSSAMDGVGLAPSTPGAALASASASHSAASASPSHDVAAPLALAPHSRSPSPFPPQQQTYWASDPPHPSSLPLQLHGQHGARPSLHAPPLPSQAGSHHGNGSSSSQRSSYNSSAHNPNGGGGGGHPSPSDTRTQLFVSNLPFRVRWQDLKDLMRKCGTVLRADVALSPTDGRSRGFGVVLYARNEDATKAIEVYHGYTWQTRVLDVRIDTQDPRGEIALAEANRQNALQQQAAHYQMLHQQHAAAAAIGNFAWPSPAGMMMPFPPPPPMMPNRSFPSAHPPPPPPSAQSSSASHLGPLSNPSHPSASPSMLSASTAATSVDGGSIPSPEMRGSRTPQLSAALAPGSTNGHHDPAGGFRSRPDMMAGHHGNDVRNSTPNGVGRGSGPIGFGQFNGTPPPPPPMPSMMMMMPMPGQGPSGMIPSFSHGQRAPGPNQIPPQYIGRHLFVGNLPFNCQWQELKDLMRSAGGSVLRADIAQGPDGRSRGFGSVLFANAADAERAVQMFNGHEFNGRTLKVHFDKFAGAGGPTPPPPPPGWPQQHMGGPFDLSRSVGGGSGGDPRFAQHHQSPLMWSSPPRDLVPVTLQDRQPLPLHELSEEVREAHKAELAGEETSMHPLASSLAPLSNASEAGFDSSAASESTETLASISSEEPRGPAPRPGRIAMPPSYPFASGGPLSANGPLSPGAAFSPTAGRLPPMTPSMPAFTLGAFPQTPPLHPASFFSPGIGPFSPQMGSPFFGPGAYGLNAAPGAPVHGSYNPMFPPMMPDEPSYPSSSSMAPVSSVEVDDDSKTPPAKANNGLPSTPNDPASSYFPASETQVQPSLDESLAALRLSNASQSPPPQPDGWASGPDPSSTSAEEDQASLLHPSNSIRRKSFVPGAAGVDQRGQEAFDIRRRFEGDRAGLGEGAAVRRASLGEEGHRRPKFGTSIWG